MRTETALELRDLRVENKRLRKIESALRDFLDALLIAKRNDDVMSVVDTMLAVHVESEIMRERLDWGHLQPTTELPPDDIVAAVNQELL